MREEKRRKEEEEKEARKRAEEEERRRREEEEGARRRAEEEEERRRKEEEEARRKAEEEEVRRRAEEEEAARKEQEAQKKREEAEKSEPQTREDPDIELVTEEMLDDNLPVQEREEEIGEEDGEVNTSSHTEEEQGRDEELEDEELDLETNGTLAEAGPQLDEKEEDEDLENQTLEQSDSKPVLPSDGVTSNALTPTSPGEGLDKQAPSDTPSNAEQKRVRAPPISRGQSSRSQEKREQRRRRGLEHNQRETERASSSASSKDQTSPPKSKSQEASKLKERADSKELDQYTFVAWKMKEDKGGKKEVKPSPPSATPVRPSTLSLQPADPVPERNGLGEGGGSVNLQRRPGAIKEKPEKWRGRRSDGELPESTSPPPHNREERRKKTLYVFCSGHILRSTITLINGFF